MRAAAWLNELDRFLTRLKTQLSDLAPASQSLTRPADAAALAAAVMLEAHAVLDGIGQLCDAGGTPETQTGERLIFSDVRVEECTVTERLAHTVPVRHQLVSASRVPYGRFLINRVCM